MNGLTISDLVGSSQNRAIADDALKDEDNAAWVMGLESGIQQEWVERIAWIRLVDRLAEKELVDANSLEFRQFCAEWQCLIRTGSIQPDFEYGDVLSNIYDRWFNQRSNPINQLSIQAWNRFLSASTRYHQPDLTIPTLEAYEIMLQTLSGSCFQLLPFLQPKHWEIAYFFGALDQFFNNLRDLREDAEQGICYLPTEILEAFGVHREEILQLQAGQNPNFRDMMRFWLNHFLPILQQKTTSLVAATDLHPSWKMWRDWSFHRYQRIERIFHECNFDYTLFPQIYWTEVQQELPTLLIRLKMVQKGRSAVDLNCHYLNTNHALIPEILARLSSRATRGMKLLQDWLYYSEADSAGRGEVY